MYISKIKTQSVGVALLLVMSGEERHSSSPDSTRNFLLVLLNVYYIIPQMLQEYGDTQNNEWNTSQK